MLKAWIVCLIHQWIMIIWFSTERRLLSRIVNSCTYIYRHPSTCTCHLLMTRVLSAGLKSKISLSICPSVCPTSTFWLTFEFNFKCSNLLGSPTLPLLVVSCLHLNLFLGDSQTRPRPGLPGGQCLMKRRIYMATYPTWHCKLSEYMVTTELVWWQQNWH